MKVKTYGVVGLTEWHGRLKSGSIEVSVSFTGGTASPSGAQPAYYMTKDPIVQFVIEHSKEFKSGFIILVMSQDVAGEHPRMAIPRPKSPPVSESPTPIVKKAGTPTAPAEGIPVETEVATPEVGAEDAAGGKIKVADKPDAIEWLKEHFPGRGYTATKLRTQTAFEAACKECGVEFVFTA